MQDKTASYKYSSLSVPGNTVVLHRSGEATFKKMADWIRQAQFEVQLQTYIMAADRTGHLITDALLDAASRGVAIFVLLDAYGSLELMRHKAWMAKCIAAGIQIKWFGRPFTNENISIGRRLHHKLLIIDGKRSLVGGFNIADRYNDIAEKPAWLDFGLQVDGPMAAHLRNVANKYWRRSNSKPVNRPFWLDHKEKGDVPVRLLRNDWLLNIYELNTEYRHAFYHAEREIIIVGAYFTPGRRIRQSLARAIDKGVTVKLIVSQQNDVWLAKYATRYLYEWLLKKGVLIYEWPTTVVHGKVAVVDNYWATVGSYNLNFLSAYESIELNYVIEHTPTANSIRETLQTIIEKDCTPCTWTSFTRTHTWLERSKEWLAYRIFRLLSRWLVFMGRRNHTQRH